MLLTSFALAALAIALAWPVPILLARASWPDRAPGTALVIWQSIALAGGLSMIGAMLTFGLVPFGDNLVAGLHRFGLSLANATLPPGAMFLQMFALSGAVLLSIHLLLSLVTTFVRTERLRRRHRALVTLLSNPMPSQPGTRLIEHAAPVAYCLPGTTRSVTVLSAGLVSLLDDAQLRAVIAHERAHALQRHHLVLLSFRAWRGALPWFPIATRAQGAVALLVEMLADDHARREVTDATLGQSIALVASTAGDGATTAGDGELPAGFDPLDPLAAAGPTATRRIARLSAGSRGLSAPARALAFAFAAGLLAIPTVLLVWPALV
ncbi:M56 family metallopeptidase [Microbacterium sp. STN6]|uniref:M56 family metallopeptidase n=1 Tax=Microbacterium sp. STN6 TaxID=2995588 RepID=UPI002260F06D|nr:M56 family metallopeptidase [Microbacterium sp. STN6]MCX7521652.1 M56 family metallopeptidase [Microbacterium sp. STN6]